MAASIVVDIKAQITGYQEQIAKLQAALNKVKLEGGIGKELTNEINDIQKLINNLNKNSNIRITSDSGIDHLVDKMTTISERIQEVSVKMQDLTLDNLDFSKLSQGTQDALKDLQALQNKLESNMTQGLQEKLQSAVEHGSALGRTLEKLQVDIKSLDAESGKEILNTAFENANQKAHETANEIKELRAEIKQYQNDISNLKQSGLLDQSFNLPGQLDKLRDMKGVASGRQKDYLSVENGGASAAIIEQWQTNLAKLEIKSDEAKSKIQDFFKALSTTSDLNQAKTLVQDFLNSYSSLGVKATELRGIIKIKDLVDTATVDPNKVTEVKNTITDLLKQAGDSIKPEEGARIEALINSGSLESARQKTISLLTKTYADIVSELQKKQGELSNALEQLGVKREELGQQMVERSDISRANTGYDNIVQKLTEENAGLKARVDAVEKLVNEKLVGDLGKVKGTGTDIGHQSQQSLLEAKEAANLYKTELEQVQAKEKLIGKIEGVVQRWFSIYAAVRMVGNAIRSVISTVQELDKTITEIAIVTDMTQDELWGQMKSYTDMARQYAASISGVYEVSQLYYQQGLETADVMALTEETLKMARISGLGYAEATDYMTNAVRSFKMEMTDAQRVVDVYSEIAASSATSTSELASAMSKTASSAEAVGSSFENTTAMMAVMIEATRESAENIGSAMKSIISRYGEMTTDPSKLTDSEGQEMSLNKVDKALKSVGISIQDTNHQFRDFDDVITELAGKWDTIDTNTQRYIATVMAGNRQQSRFLALVSNGERLAELSEAAANSQDAATLQVLKTMDSIEAKTQQFKTSLQSLYTDTGIENLYKGFLDIANNIVKSFTEMRRIGKAPVLAIASIGMAFSSLANVVTNVFAILKARLSMTIDSIKAKMTLAASEGVTTRVVLTQTEMQQIAEAWANNAQTYELNEKKLSEIKARGVAERTAMETSAASSTHSAAYNFLSKHKMGISTGLNLAGLAISTIGANTQNKTANGILSTTGSTFQGAGLGLTLGGPIGAAVGGALGFITGAISNWTKVFPSLAQQIEDAQKDAVEKNNTYIQKIASTRDLNQEIDNFKKLEKARYDSVESEEEYLEASNRMGETYPNLIQSFDEAGNAIIDLQAAEDELTRSREAAVQAAQEAAVADYKAAILAEKSAKEEGAANASNVLQTNISGIGPLASILTGVLSKESAYDEAFNYFRIGEESDEITGALQLDNIEFGSKILEAFTESISNGLNAEGFLDALIAKGVFYSDTKDNSEEDLAPIYDWFNQQIAARGDIFSSIQESSDQLGLTIEEFYSLLSAYANFEEGLETELPKGFSEFLTNIQSGADAKQMTSLFSANEGELIAEAERVMGSEEEADQAFKSVAKAMLSLASQLGIYQGDILKAEEVTKETAFKGINQTVTAMHSGKDNAFLTEMTDISKIISQQAMASWTGGDENAYNDFLIKDLPKLVQDLDENWGQYWEGLNTSEKERFNNLIKNYKQYSDGQATKEFEALGIEDPSAIIEAYYKDAYNFDKFKSRMESKSGDIENKLGNVINENNQNFYESLGENELLAVNDIYDRINNLIRNNSLSEIGGKELYTQFEALGQEISSLPDTMREPAEKILYSWEDFSINGVLTLANSLEKLGIPSSIVENAKQLTATIPVNLETEAQTLLTSTVENMEDFGKALTNAYKGMDLKAATEMAAKLDLNIAKDFKFKEGKYFLNNPDKIKEGYLKYSDEYFSYLEEEFTSQEQQLKNQIESFERTGNIKGILETGNELTQLIASHEETKQAFIEYREYQINSILIQNGQIQTFLESFQNEDGSQKFDQDKINEYISQIGSGNFEELPEEIKQYTSELWNVYKDAGRSVYESAITSIFDGKQLVEVNAANKEALADLLNRQDLENGEEVWLDFAQDINTLRNAILNNQKLSPEAKRSLLASVESKATEIDASTILKDIANSYENLSYELATKYSRLLGFENLEEYLGTAGTAIKKDISGNYIAEYNDLLEEITNNQNLTLKERNDTLASLAKQKREKSDTTILSTIFQNRDKLSEENIASLATVLEKGYDKIFDYLRPNVDGSYTLNLTNIQRLINEGKIEINDELNQLIANEIDNIISSLTGLGTLQNKGTTSIEDMQKRIDYVNSYAEREELRTTLEESFVYNEQLNSFVYSTEGLQKYAKALYTQLQSLKNENIEATDQIWAVEQSLKSITVQMANNIDLQSLVNADLGSAEALKATTAITKAVDNYNSVLRAMAEEGEKVATIDADALIESIGAGGEAAVIAAQKIAELQGKTLSADEIEGYYRREIQHYVNAIDQVTARPGEIVDAVTAAIIGLDNVEQLGTTGQYVVKSAANLYEAYNKLLQRMAETGEATLADLNKVAGLALDNKDGQQVAIDALGDAANLTYSRLGEIFTSANKLMTEELIQDWTDKGLIKALGGNKIQITDFAKFAELMEFDTGSPEYVSAFKTYNDSLIDMNRQTEHNILEEAQNVAGAKGGDWINLTQLSDKLSKIQIGARPLDTALNLLITSLPQFGAQLEDGILKLGQNANIPAIMQEIAQVTAESGGLLTNELAELADAVADAIKGYADLISGGIEGSLSNEGAQQLQQWASANGIGKLNFIETADGLKVATDQAFELVAALRQVDSMQGKLTFDNLVESLSADKGGRFENISKTTAEIAKIQNQINKNQKDIALARHYGADKDNEQIKALESQNAKLREQLNLYTQIQQRQSIDPSQYNFMDRDIPEVMQGPINYWNSVGKAYAALNETAQTGKMDIQDFTNIVNEMSNLAATSGQKLMFFGEEIDGSAENAAALIQKGYSALSNVDGKGVQIDLSKMGIQFAAGADNAKNNFDKGVQSLADAQIAILDAAIKVLEVVVAMEQLGDIDVENKGTLDLGEIFADSGIENNGDFTKDFKKWADSIYEQTINPEDIEHYNEDLAKALDAISIGGTSLKDMIYAASNNIEDAEQAWKDLNMTEQQYQAVINAFYQAMLNGDYNLDTIQDSVWEILNQTLPDGTVIELGDRTIIVSGDSHFSINWEDKSVKEALKYFGEDVEKSKEEVTKAVQRYQTGNGDAIDAIITLAVNGEIQIETDDDGNINIIGPNGQEIDPKSDAGRKILSEAALKHAGIEDGDVITDPMGHFIRSEGTIKIGNTTFKVISDEEGNVSYYSEKLGRNFNSSEELLEKEYAAYYGEQNEQQLPTMNYEAWAYQTYGIHVDSTTKFIGSDGSEITNFSNDPAFRNSVKKFLSQSQANIQDQLNNLESDGAGHYTLKLPDGEAITVDASGPEEAAEKIQGEIETAFAPMALSVSTGITEAFTNSESGVSEAIGNAVASAITDLTFTENQTPKIPEIQAEVTNVKITKIGGATYEAGEENVTPPNIDSLNATVNSLKLDASEIDVDSVGEQIQEALEELEITVPIKTPTPSNRGNSNEQQPENSSSTMTMTVTVNDEASEQINQIQEEASTPTDMPIKADSDGSAANKIKQLNQSAKSPVLKTVNVNANLTTQYKTTIAEATKPEDKTINIKTSGSVNTGSPEATGNVALSKGTTGSALAGGRTLMGELGPELVVSKGRYFVVGQNGPEMVNLAPDAIVFNHLQTRQLLSKGKTGTHATPVTNEKKAVSFATGNANGPAMASASEALAALKQLRAMWESLRNASLKDMGGMSGGSGGGGGGGGGNDDTKQAVAGVTAEVERWYNWLTKIETTEEHINKLTKEHTLLEKQRISTNQKLNNLQQQYNDLANNRDTRIQLAKEQTAYRNQLLNQVGFDANGNPRSALSAFYRAGANGELLLAQDKAFSDFVAKRGDFSAENKARIAAGQSVAMTVTQQRGITAEEAKKLNAANKKSGKTDYKAGDIVEEALTKKQAKALGLKVGTKLGETITNITLPTSGLALMEELQKRDEFGNLVYNAKSQYDMLQKLGFGSFMTQDSQGNQIDTSTDEGIATAVQNFYDRVDGAKEEIESLTSSINEQEQTALDDAIAMQEINEQIIELYKPISGVTEELEEWYNYLRRINDLQAENNLLVKENELLQSNQTAEGDRIYNNLKQRTELLMQQRLEQEALLKAQQQQTRELQNQVLNDKRLRDFFSSNGEGNSLLFNEGVMGQNFQYLSEQQLKKNSLGYYIDEKGQYIDQTGILRNANNEVVTNGQFGQVQLDENSVQVKTFNSKGKTLTEIVEELNKQNLDGSFVYGASEAYQILKTMGLGDFMRFDENGNELYANFGELTREEQQNAINTGIKRLQEIINNINENVDTQKQTELDILDTDKELIDIKNTLRENAISVENNFKEAIVQERQNAIDTKNELKDALNNAIDKTINGLKDSLEAERKTYDSDKDEKELTALQSQLALLRSSNGSLGKIRDLQNKIRDKQQQMYFAERENAIDELEKSAENQIEALETQIDIMQTALDYQVENGLIWAEINAKLSEWSPEQIASYISQINKDYAKGPTEQEKVMNETLENAQLYKQQQTIPLPTIANRNVATPQVINKNVTTPQLPPKVTTPAPTATATSPIATTATIATSQVQQEEKREEKEAFSNIIPVIKDGLKYYTKNKANYKTKAAGVLKAGDSFVVEGLSNKKTYKTKKDGTRYMMKAKVGSKSVYVPLWYTYLPENLYDNLVSAGLPRFKKGGAVDFTGPAWVDGSKSKPEQIFNFEQMEQLREIFYENLAMTQVGISGLSSIVDNLPNTNSYNSINNEDYGVNIGQLDFHMEVQEIANGYDARRAGREAMEEMVRIARKTGNRSVSRR